MILEAILSNTTRLGPHDREVGATLSIAAMGTGAVTAMDHGDFAVALDKRQASPAYSRPLDSMTAVILLFVPVTLCASVFVAWIDRHLARSMPCPAASCSLAAVADAGASGGANEALARDRAHYRHRRRRRRQRRLVAVIHVLLLSTTVNLFFAGISPAYLALVPPTASAEGIVTSIMLTVPNMLGALIAQTVGELALLYQFSCMYHHDPFIRQFTLSISLLLVLIRFIGQAGTFVATILTRIDPTSPLVPTYRLWQTYLVSAYTISLVCIMALVSATFVFKLGTRYLRARQSQRSLHSQSTVTRRIRGILAASMHHTLLTCVAAIVMTATFPHSAPESLALWINVASMLVYKLAFALGISRSLFHMAFDVVVAVPGEWRAAGEQEHARRGRQVNGQVVDQERSDAVAMTTIFRYNSWQSESEEHEPVLTTECASAAAADSNAAARVVAWWDDAAWPIATCHFESGPAASAYYSSSHSRPMSTRTFTRGGQA